MLVQVIKGTGLRLCTGGQRHGLRITYRRPKSPVGGPVRWTEAPAWDYVQVTKAGLGLCTGDQRHRVYRRPKTPVWACTTSRGTDLGRTVAWGCVQAAKGTSLGHESETRGKPSNEKSKKTHTFLVCHFRRHHAPNYDKPG